MHWIKLKIQRIQELLDQGSEPALTYAALEARLAIEQVCYERLKVTHEYISHKDLRRWQPRNIVAQLMQEVEPHIASPVVLSIKNAENDEYVEIGRQVGFDHVQLGNLWHALGSFLHVQVPKNKDDAVCSYGSKSDIVKKINEIIMHLKKMENQTLLFPGIGELVSLNCKCGSKNMRRKAFLKNGQIVSCINPDCVEKWQIGIEGESIVFKQQSVTLQCYSCSQVHDFPIADLPDPRPYNAVKFNCSECGAESFLRWELVHKELANPSS